MEYNAKSLWIDVLKNYDIDPKYLDKLADYCLMHASLEAYLSSSLPSHQSTIYPSIKVLSKLGDYLDKIEFVDMPNFVKDEEKFFSVGTYGASLLIDKRDVSDLLVMHGIAINDISRDFYENLSEVVSNQIKKLIDDKGPIYVYFVISDMKSRESQKDVTDDKIKFFAASRLVPQSSYSVPEKA